MKRFRPYAAGYIVIYVLALLCLGDVIWTAIRQARGVNDLMSGFSFFSYLMFALAACYAWQYLRSQVAIDEQRLRLAWPANIRPKQGQPRAMIIFRQGDLDLKFVDKTIRLDSITRYGYVEDLGYERIDRSQGKETSKIFPVHEVAFITNENKRYHINAGVYSPRQRKEMFTLIRDRSGVEPEGKLAEVLKQ